MVAAVTPRTPAARAGLRPGDRILAINGAAAARRDRLPLPRGRGASAPLGRAGGAGADRAASPRRLGARAPARGPAPGRDRHLRQQVRVLLHPPASEGDAQEPVREGRRLPALVPARQLHHADGSGGGRARAHRGAAPLAALRLGARHRPRAAPRPPGPAARAPRAAAGDGAARQGGHRHARADRAVPGLERRPAPRPHRARAGPAPSRGADHRGGAGRPHPPPRAAPRSARGDGRGGGRARARHRGLAARVPRHARHPLRVGRRRALPAGGAAAARRARVRGLRGGRGRHRPRAPLRGCLRPRGEPPARAAWRARGT